MKRGCVYLMLFCLLSVSACWVYQTAYPDTRGTVLFRYDNQGPTQDTVERLNEIAPNTFFAWTHEQDATVKSEETGGSITVDALYGYGLMNGVDVLTGQMPFFARSRICALDQQTALRLFGSADIIGRPVTFNDMELTVVCVYQTEALPALFDTGDGMVLCPAAIKEKPFYFRGVDFKVPAGGSLAPDEQASQWLSDAMVQGSPTQTVLETEAAKYAFLTSLPTLAACLMAAVSLARARIPVSYRLGGLAVFAALLLTGVIPLAAPPAEWIPTRWSDADFYPNLLTTLFNGFTVRRMRGTPRPDLVRGGLSALSAGLAFASIPFYALFQSKVNLMLTRGDSPK